MRKRASTPPSGTLTLGDYNYKVDSETKTITNKDYSVSLTLTNTQVPPVYELAITKQGLDEDGKKTELLKGVVFKLEKLKGNGVDATFNDGAGFHDRDDRECWRQRGQVQF